MPATPAQPHLADDHHESLFCVKPPKPVIFSGGSLVPGASGVGASRRDLPAGGDTIHMAAAPGAPQGGKLRRGRQGRRWPRVAAPRYIGIGFAGNRLSHRGGGSGQRTRGFSEAAGTAGEGGAAQGPSWPHASARLKVSTPASKEPCQAHSAHARTKVPKRGLQHVCQLCTTPARLAAPMPALRHPCWPSSTLVGLQAPLLAFKHPCQP